MTMMTDHHVHRDHVRVLLVADIAAAVVEADLPVEAVAHTVVVAADAAVVVAVAHTVVVDWIAADQRIAVAVEEQHAGTEHLLDQIDSVDTVDHAVNKFNSLISIICHR